MMACSSKIFDEILQLHVIDTHEHIYPPDIITQKRPSIVDILEGSYFFWIAKPLEKKNDYNLLIDRIREVNGSAFFKACSLAIRDLYGISIDPPSIESLKEASKRIREAYKDPDWIKRILKDKALIDKAIWDPCWDILREPFDRSLFTLALRIDPFLIGYSRDVTDRDGNTPYIFEERLNIRVEKFDDYLTLIDKVIEEGRKKKCVCIKCASAYDRSIAFDIIGERLARQIFRKSFEKGEPLDAKEIKFFGDFIMNYILSKVRNLDVPVQIHTGLAKVEGSNPINLVNMLRKYNDITFILLHGGYPWIREFAILGFSFPNVYLDLCWLPIISPSACKTLLKELIELGLTAKITWGGDCFVAEGTYGSLKMFKRILSEVLIDFIENGYLSYEQAIEIAFKILYENALNLFKLKAD